MPGVREIPFVIIAIVLMICFKSLPPVGDPHLPAYADFISPDIPNEEVAKKGVSVALRYDRMSISDMNSISVVGGLILDYRGYDTMYETTVLYTALISVLAVIGLGIKNDKG